MKCDIIYDEIRNKYFIYSVIEYCTINPINGGPETNDIVLKFYAVYIVGGEHEYPFIWLIKCW